MKKNFLFVWVLMGTALFCSCVDEKWDLENIDFTLGTNSHITLPKCSTGDIILKNIMDLQEDGVVQTVADPAGGEDIFVVTQKGSADVNQVKIDEVKISRPKDMSFDANIDRESLDGKSSRRKSVTITIPVNVGGTTQTVTKTVDIPDVSYAYRIKNTDKTEFHLEDSYAVGISKDVVSIDNIKVSGATVTLDLSEVLFHGAPQITSVHMDDVYITIPVGLLLSEAKFVYNGKSHTAKVDSSNGRVVLTEGESESIRLNQPIQLVATFDGANLGKDIIFEQKADGGEVTLGGMFRVDGQFRVETREMDEAAIQRQIDHLSDDQRRGMYDTSTGKVNIDLVELGLIPNQLEVIGKASFASDINVNSVSGTLRHELANVAPIKLDDMPDFLNDEDVVLDLENPLVFVAVENEVPATATTGVTLRAEYGKTGPSAATSVTRSSGTLEFHQGDNFFMLADHDTNFRPRVYQNAQFIRVEDLGGLIRKIPEQIYVDVEPVTVKATDLKIPGTYDVGVNYEVYAPLSFGKQFQLVYQDTERGWADDLGDLDNVDAEAIWIEGDIDSDLPAALTFSIEPLDEECQIIPQIESVNIAVPANAKNHHFTATIKPVSGHTLNDVFAGKNGVHQLDGVRYKAVINDPNEGETLRANAKVRLHDLKLTLGAVTYDAN